MKPFHRERDAAEARHRVDNIFAAMAGHQLAHLGGRLSIPVVVSQWTIATWVMAGSADRAASIRAKSAGCVSSWSIGRPRSSAAGRSEPSGRHKPRC